MRNLYYIIFAIVFFQSFITLAQVPDSSRTPLFKADEVKKRSAKIYYNIPSEEYVMVFYRALGESDWHASKLRSSQGDESSNFIKLTNLMPAAEYEYTAMVLKSALSNHPDLAITYKISGTFTTIPDYACPLPGYGYTLPQEKPSVRSNSIAFSNK